MKRDLVILKLGGSIITYKNNLIPKVRTHVIKRLAKEIKQILDENKYKLIIIHGVGSFGHPLAKKHDLINGMATDEEILGYCQMEQQDLILHNIIISELIKSKIPAIGLSPCSFAQTTGKKFSGFNLKIIKSFLKQNIIPVIHGDGITDIKQGCSILSGDVILPYLAKKLRANKAIFLSDVDGVFNSDPKKNPQAKLITEINNSNLGEVLKGLTHNNPNDVSGEMRGKVLEIKNRLSILKVYIVNGLKPKILIKAFEEQEIGTQLHFH